jgi:multiple sugar transport system permease protein
MNLPTSAEAILQVRTRLRFWQSDNFWGLLFISPQLIGLLLFTLMPIGMSLYLCFTSWDFINPPLWTGLANFQRVFADPLFWQSLTNTLVIVAGIVPLTLVLALFFALLTDSGIRFTGLYQSAFYFPMVTSSVAVALVWFWLYAPDFGLINSALSFFGIAGPGWMTDPHWSKLAVVLMVAWQTMGYYYLIFLAGLKNIPREYHEAAAIDGAGRLQRFFRITLPLLSPTTFFVVITSTISAFNLFSEVYVMTRGGPVNSTYTLVMHIYNLAFKYFRMGDAAVVSWVLFAVLAGLTFIQFRFSRKWVEYGL